MPLARSFADLLVRDATVRGLIGPREPARIWSRHLLNCAAVTEVIPAGERIVDVGTGAGLPGLAMAIRRPDLRVDLVETLQRRVAFLHETVAALGLAEQVRVVSGRAEDGRVQAVVAPVRWVTARAVAPLDRLVRWCLPLLSADGTLALLKGERAAGEVAQHRTSVRRAGAQAVRVVQCGAELPEPTSVVLVEIDPRRAVRRRGD